MAVLPTSAATRQAIIIKYDATANEREFLVLVGHNITNDWNKITWNVQEVATAYDSTTDLKGSTILTTNRWYHVVVTYQGGNHMRIYLDGNLEVEDTTGIPTDFTNTAEPLYVGWLEDADRSFNGLIDDVRIYNRALSAGEITQLYKQGAAKLAVSPVNSLKSGLVGYWTFDGKDTNWGTNKTNDLSGQGNTGTLTSMSTTTSPTVGKLGQGLKFSNAAQSEVLTTFTQQLNDFTACAWFYVNNADVLTNNYQRIIDKAYDTGFWMGHQGGGGASDQWGGGVISGTYIFVTLATNQWHHLCSKRSGTTLTIIGDGGSVTNTVTVSGAALSTIPLRIASSYNAPINDALTGKVDDVRKIGRAHV